MYICRKCNKLYTKGWDCSHWTNVLYVGLCITSMIEKYCNKEGVIDLNDKTSAQLLEIRRAVPGLE